MLLEEQEKVKALLREAVTVLCRNGLTFNSELTVEGLLGITVDNKEVFLVNINEKIKHDNGSTGKDEAHGIVLEEPKSATSKNKSVTSGSKVRKRGRETLSASSENQKTAEEPNSKKAKDDTDSLVEDGNEREDARIQVKREKNADKKTENNDKNVGSLRD